MEDLTKNNLTISVQFDDKNRQILLNWQGKSTDRTPEFVLIPFFNQAVEEAESRNYIIVNNFFDLVYMNSSTINPIVQLIKLLKEKQIKSKIVYNKDLKWQKMTLSTLNVFVSDDNLLEIEEVHKDWKLA
jgi:hypothetical protein